MDPRLEVDVAAAKAAGEVALHYFRTGLMVEYKGNRPPVTRADRECEQRIIEVLHAAFPEYGVVGEEFGTAIASNGCVHDEILRLVGTAPPAA